MAVLICLYNLILSVHPGFSASVKNNGHVLMGVSMKLICIKFARELDLVARFLTGSSSKLGWIPRQTGTCVIHYAAYFLSTFDFEELSQILMAFLIF